MRSKLQRAALRCSMAAIATAALASCVPRDTAAVMAPAIDVEAELVVRFDDAVIFCDQRLQSLSLDSTLVAQYGDAALYASRQRHPEAESSRVITTGPHEGQTISVDESPSTNACVEPSSIQSGRQRLRVGAV